MCSSDLPDYLEEISQVLGISILIATRELARFHPVAMELVALLPEEALGLHKGHKNAVLDQGEAAVVAQRDSEYPHSTPLSGSPETSRARHRYNFSPACPLFSG